MLPKISGDATPPEAQIAVTLNPGIPGPNCRRPDSPGGDGFIRRSQTAFSCFQEPQFRRDHRLAIGRAGSPWQPGTGAGSRRSPPKNIPTAPAAGLVAPSRSAPGRSNSRPVQVQAGTLPPVGGGRTLTTAAFSNRFLITPEITPLTRAQTSTYRRRTSEPPGGYLGISAEPSATAGSAAAAGSPTQPPRLHSPSIEGTGTPRFRAPFSRKPRHRNSGAGEGRTEPCQQSTDTVSNKINPPETAAKIRANAAASDGRPPRRVHPASSGVVLAGWRTRDQTGRTRRSRSRDQGAGISARNAASAVVNIPFKINIKLVERTRPLSETAGCNFKVRQPTAREPETRALRSHGNFNLHNRVKPPLTSRDKLQTIQISTSKELEASRLPGTSLHLHAEEAITSRAASIS